IGALLAIDSYLVRRPVTPSVLLASLGFGTAIGFVAGFDLPSFTVLATLLVVPPIVLGPGRLPTAVGDARSPRAIVPGFLLALPLGGISIAFSYSLALRLEVQGPRLFLIAAGLFILAPTAAVMADRIAPRIPGAIARIGSLLLAAVLGGVLLVLRGTIPTTLALLGLFAALDYAALAGLRRFASRGGHPDRALASAIGFLPLFVLFFRAPPITISLVLVPLPEAIEFILYTPTALIGLTALVVALGGWIVSRRARRRGMANV
ncbi:MAG TPA: hypothetical protein VJP06_04965, partial [Thermoplasmata archaeon]|nr:hypothetical protein [Thermoplasmata archaeon]